MEHLEVTLYYKEEKNLRSTVLRVHGIIKCGHIEIDHKSMITTKEATAYVVKKEITFEEGSDNTKAFVVITIAKGADDNEEKVFFCDTINVPKPVVEQPVLFDNEATTVKYRDKMLTGRHEKTMVVYCENQMYDFTEAMQNGLLTVKSKQHTRNGIWSSDDYVFELAAGWLAKEVFANLSDDRAGGIKGTLQYLGLPISLEKAYERFAIQKGGRFHALMTLSLPNHKPHKP